MAQPIRVLAVSFGTAISRFYSDCAELSKILKLARKAREAGSLEGDFVLSDRPLTLGALVAGARGMRTGVTWGSNVGANMAQNFGHEIVDWNLKPEDMFVFQVWGASPAEGHQKFGQDCFEAAKRNNLFDIAYRAVCGAVNVDCIRRPLLGASNVFAWFTTALSGKPDLEVIQALLGVSPYAFSSIQAMYCGIMPEPHSGKYAGSTAAEYAAGLRTLIPEVLYAQAIEFLNLYLVQLATHGANYGELAAFRRQQGESFFNPIGSLQTGFEHLSADSHGGAQSLVLEMMFNAMEYCQKHGRTKEALLQWAKGRKGLFMGLGHAKYRTPDPRGVVLSDYARSVPAMAQDERFTFFEFFLEHISDILAAVKPSITNKNPNVDFWAALLQFMFLGITNPEALELLFGMARVPAYIKSALICKTLGFAIERPDEVTLDEMVEITGIADPFADPTLFQRLE